MKFVYSLGGSILAGRDAQSLREYAKALKELAREHQIFVVVGGGRIAREYIEKARALGASEIFCDSIGIGATKLNLRCSSPPWAMLRPRRFQTPIPRRIIFSHRGHGRPLAGPNHGRGLCPAGGTSRRGPAHRPRPWMAFIPPIRRRTPLPKSWPMTPRALVRLAMDTELKAGSRSPIDPLAAKIIERSSIPTAVVLGSKIENLRKGALGGHQGTEIKLE